MAIVKVSVAVMDNGMMGDKGEKIIAKGEEEVKELFKLFARNWDTKRTDVGLQFYD